MTSLAANSLNMATSAKSCRYCGASSLNNPCSAIVVASVLSDVFVFIFSLSKNFHVQTSSTSRCLRDTGKSAQRQVSALRIYCRSRGGVNLHQRDLCSSDRQF